MASSTAVWSAVSTGEGQGAAASTASLNFPQTVAYTKEGGMSASGHSMAHNSCASYFDLLMQLLPLPRHSSFIGCCTGNNTAQPDSPLQPQTTANNVEPLMVDNDSDLPYVPTYSNSSSTNSSSTQQNLSRCMSQSSNVERLWIDNATHLTNVPTYSNSCSNQQSLSLGTPRPRRPAAMTCPPAPVRPRPTMILVPAEELHICNCIE